MDALQEEFLMLKIFYIFDLKNSSCPLRSRDMSCKLLDTFVIILLFAPLLERFWLNLYSLDSLGSFW
jgi:hypothetical protein